MSRIALVVSDVDGTLLTRDKTLTDSAKAAVRRLHEAKIAFTITSSRPAIGMRFLIEPLQIKVPVGAFNGSCIIDVDLNPIELAFAKLKALLRKAAARSKQSLWRALRTAFKQFTRQECQNFFAHDGYVSV